MSIARQVCIDPHCKATYAVEDVLYRCRACGDLLDIEYDWDRAEMPGSLRFFETRWATPGRSNRALLDFSGVWRFRELLPFADRSHMVTIGEGRTLLQQSDGLGAELGLKPGGLFLQYEGFNPSGSFKDNGMAAAFTIARRLKRTRVACASTGNTSASMALYAAAAAAADRPMQALVFIGSGKIAAGKLSQALDHGALTLQVRGDFDACMQHVAKASERLDLYLMNSVNPFRLEGQKTIMYRILEGLDWEVPDWIVVPGGNLGNTSAFGKAWFELRVLGLVKSVPRIAVINAAGASTLATIFNDRSVRWNGGDLDREAIDAVYADMDRRGARAHTVASAIEINRPVNLPKALRALELTDGVVRAVEDADILEHKALVARHGFGCEPASAATLAGLRRLLEEQIIDKGQRVVCVLTGHELKDADATVSYHLDAADTAPRGRLSNRPLDVDDDLESICRVIEGEPSAATRRAGK
jgi:threonine synthase